MSSKTSKKIKEIENIKKQFESYLDDAFAMLGKTVYRDLPDIGEKFIKTMEEKSAKKPEERINPKDI